MRIVLTLVVAIALLLASGCSLQHDRAHVDTTSMHSTDPSDTSVYVNGATDTDASSHVEGNVEYTFQDEIDLTFIPVELMKLDEIMEKQSKEIAKSVSLGMVKQQEVLLHLYEEVDEDHPCSTYGIATALAYNGRMYEIQECVTNSMMNETYATSGGIQLLNPPFESASGEQMLLAAVELFANIPGQMLHIVYDSANDQWLTFIDWGVPFLVELGPTREPIVVSQFAGGGMHWPDASIYRWKASTLERTQSMKTVLGIDDQNWNEVSYSIADNNVIFEAAAVVNLNKQIYESATYRYDDEKLYKITK